MIYHIYLSRSNNLYKKFIYILYIYNLYIYIYYITYIIEYVWDKDDSNYDRLSKNNHTLDAL
jgi:hypothetical protein